jgi:hypothetical protein
VLNQLSTGTTSPFFTLPHPISLSSILILWHVEPLPGNDREINNYTTALGNDSNRRALNNGGTVEGGVFCAVRAEVI